MSERLRVNPRILYPMTTIESIDPDILAHVVQEVKRGQDIPVIGVIDFRGYYVIWDGNYEMLAANIAGKLQVDVEVIPWREQSNWLLEETIEEQLKAVGMNSLYDFEALGGFRYSEYPVFYDGGK